MSIPSAKHALLAPSSANKWLNCPPSARLEDSVVKTTSTFADEGTLAHELAEGIIRDMLGWTNALQYVKMLERIQHHELYKPIMFSYCYDYASYVIESYNAERAQDKSARLEIETPVDLSAIVPEGFGRLDTEIITRKKIKIIDLKYGMGVPISAVNNTQLKTYASGILDEMAMWDDSIEVIELVIYQPRLDNISEWSISAEDLKKWTSEVLVPGAKLAFEGGGEFKAGAHCRFCGVKAQCAANAQYNLELAEYEFQQALLLSDHEIADIMNRADQFVNWLNAVCDFALKEAVEGRRKWPGLKLVEGRSNRAYSSEKAVKEALNKQGFNDDQIYNKKILGITEMQALLGKKYFDSALEGLITKPPGKPTLVDEEDKRPEWQSHNNPEDDFADVDTDAYIDTDYSDIF